MLPTVVLVAHGVHDRGGMERALLEVVRRGRTRYHFHVISIDLATELRPHVAWTRIHAPGRPFPLRFLLFFILAGLRLRSIDADIVHTQGAIVPTKVDISSVHFCHAGFVAATGRLSPRSSPPLRRFNNAVARLLSILAEKWCYRRSRVKILAAVSNGVACELRHHYEFPDIVLTPNGVDRCRYRPNTAERRATRLNEGVHPHEVIALFIGGDWDRKGLGLAIEATACARRNGAGLSLWIVGEGDETRFSKLAQRVGLAAQGLRFFGPRSDTERFYQAADLLVLPTSYETFSLVAYEAAASGLPVVGPAVSGIAELVGNDDAGILVEQRVASVTNALGLLAADPALRKRMGGLGRDRASAYTWERSADGVMRAYDQLAPPDDAEGST